MPARFIEIELPYPPSINHYYRHLGNRVLISRRGRAYRAALRNVLASMGISPIDGPVEMTIDVFPPDNRRRDLDNIQKPLLDALQHGGAFHDDNQVVRLETVRCEVVDHGMIIVRLTS